MKQLSRLVVLASLVVWLSGCVVAIGNDGLESRDSEWAEIERENRRAIDTLRLGMGIREAQAVMPHPADFSEAFTVQGVAYRALFYRTQRVEGDGVTARNETTPLIFANAELAGWGEAAWFDVTGRSLAEVD
ncbi:MAG TPA: DUF3192 domain-containing protein [Wenzhouxiangellaceae bacterium]|nr:DUF3192 domain-containing protein [Wenzhouxiangellaceae bacterium]